MASPLASLAPDCSEGGMQWREGSQGHECAGQTDFTQQCSRPDSCQREGHHANVQALVCCYNGHCGSEEVILFSIVILKADFPYVGIREINLWPITKYSVFMNSTGQSSVQNRKQSILL